MKPILVKLEQKTVNKLDQKSIFNVTLPMTSSKYARVFDTKMFLNVSAKLRVKEVQWLWPRDETRMATQLFELTPDQTILYLDSPSMMRKMKSGSRIQMVFKLEAASETANKEESDVRIILNVAFEGPSTRNCRGRHYNCAEFSIKEECENSCGKKSGVLDTCQWIPEKY